MMYPVKWSLNALLLFLIFQFSTSIDTITPNFSLKDGDVLVSSGQIFALGFFSPGNSKYRYVGIWYKQVPDQTVVWVANRNNPINDTSGVLAINGHGNLVLYEKNQTIPLWSTNISVTATSNIMAQLLDSGNLVLVHNDTKRLLLWQSFDYPTHTLIPFLKLGLDRRTGLNRFLTSWISEDDPGTGTFSYRIDPSGFPQLYLYKGSVPWWRSGSWTGQRWSGVPEMTSNYIFNVSYLNDQDETSIMYSVTNASIITRMVVNQSGFVQRFTWNGQNRQWIGFWSAPKEQCDYYGHCGLNSNCNPYNADKFECTCLPGFEPKSSQEWFLRDGSGGCVRKRGVSTCKSGEGFVKVARVKVPDTSMARVDMSLGLKACDEECLRNCSCMAYGSAYEGNKGGIGCLTWHSDLVDTRTYSNAGQDLYVRVDAVELAAYARENSKGDPVKKRTLVLIIMPIVLVVLLLVAGCYYLGRKHAKRRDQEKKKRRREMLFLDSATGLSDHKNSPNAKWDEESRSKEVTFFELSTVVAATDNFSSAKKLGQGGFGPVYKGQLSDGREIAVKRLSKISGQGIVELRNEVLLIAKLQHRNLVRLLGCCIEEEENMLIYEYMPNKSLDYFIFDQTRKALLDWEKRFEIILGIARGILYLHQDSRLRIIHRDLKTSNILLDGEMNPKISDFGTARIFGGNQSQANTSRVVGTFGYMSPEYVLGGLFSMKSDVFSFGVILLEIISGQKVGYIQEESSKNLTQHAWDLWSNDKALEMVYSSISDSCPPLEVLRCIQVGLLCVQDSAEDRPTMSSVVFMLSNETTLPSPKQPTFVVMRNQIDPISFSSRTNSSSVNEVTVTTLDSR